MSKQTEQNLANAIIAHFEDEGIPVLTLDATHVSILGNLGKYGTNTPAHYRTAATPLHARALHGSIVTHNGEADGPFARSYYPE